MKFLNYDKVLCLSPHPDDVEYGILGTICKYKDTQFDVFVLSQGGDFDKSTDKSRHLESEKALEHIDNAKCYFSDVKHIKNKPEDEWVSIIENKFDIDSYDCIMYPPNEDSHFEHRIINKLAPAVVRGAKCGRITYKTASVLDTWLPNLFVDLNHIGNRNQEDGHSNETHLTFMAATWYIKLNRMKTFESQTNKPYFEDDSINSFHSVYNCSKRGMSHVESFRIETAYV
tara:strand:+ start:389 stop:1075 length:687 start_codon:yes stop_codon:yes gene_type:complete